MNHTVRILLEGLPERVQEIADALDHAIPDGFEWQDFASASGEADIVLVGSSSRETPLVTRRAG